MEKLESLTERIEYGRSLNNTASKFFFSLEPTLEFALRDYLMRQHQPLVSWQQLVQMSEFELVNLFSELAQLDSAIKDLILELHHAITDYRILVFGQRYGIENDTLGMIKTRLRSADEYLNLMERVLNELLTEIN